MLILSRRIVLLSGLWALLSIAVLSLLDSLKIESFFVLCLLGFVAILLVFGPFVSRPKWRARADIVVLLGFLIFSLLTLEKVLSILHIRL